jgi:Tfp pilus assembly protein PilV
MDNSVRHCLSRRLAALRHQARSERGFTVLESLIATIVLTVALVAMAELLAVTLRMHQLGRTSAQASRLAQDKFEELMKMNFATNPAIQVNATDTLAADVANYFDTTIPGYTRRWRVSAGPAGNPSLRTVVVRVIPQVNDRRMTDIFTMTTVLRSW